MLRDVLLDHAKQLERFMRCRAVYLRDQDTELLKAIAGTLRMMAGEEARAIHDIDPDTGRVQPDGGD